MSATRDTLSVPFVAGRARLTAGEAERAVLAPSHEPSLKGRLLSPVAAACVTVAVYGLLATSLAAGLALRAAKRVA